jgi:hypothetical protein
LAALPRRVLQDADSRGKKQRIVQLAFWTNFIAAVESNWNLSLFRAARRNAQAIFDD